MPPRKPVVKLQLLCSREISRTIIDCLLNLERTGTELQKKQYQRQNQETSNESLQKVQQMLERWQLQYMALVMYLQSNPAALLEKINIALLEVYNQRYQEIDNRSLAVWVLTKGVSAPEFYKKIQSTDIWNYDSSVSRPVRIPILVTVLGVMVQPCVTVLDFRQLTLLGSVSDNVFNEFKIFLSTALTKVPKLRSLTLCSHNSCNSLPQVTNDHLELLGRHCPLLEFLDISFNKHLTGDGLRQLLPRPEQGHPGCLKLRTLYIFDCGIFEKEVAKLISHLHELTYLGYKETGKVVKTLHKGCEGGEGFRELGLTHVDNMGSKARRLIASALRCKKPVSLALSVLCPGVKHIKLRVQDDDVQNLCSLEHLETVELTYHVGSIHSPGPATQHFLQVRGGQLTSLALLCNTMSMSMLTVIAETCPGLAQLWLRSNHLAASPTPDPSVRIQHGYLSNLKILYLRVGEGELSVVHLPEYILPFLLRNTSGLRELILAVRTSTITDTYLNQLIAQCRLTELEKVLIVVPGLNSLHGIIQLTSTSVHQLLHCCPRLSKVGNLLSWSVEKEEVVELREMVQEHNYQLEILDKRMNMR